MLFLLVVHLLIDFFLQIIYYLFRKRGREGKRGKETSVCERYMVASHVPPTGDLAGNPGMYPDWELNR